MGVYGKAASRGLEGFDLAQLVASERAPQHSTRPMESRGYAAGLKPPIENVGRTSRSRACRSDQVRLTFIEGEPDLFRNVKVSTIRKLVDEQATVISNQ